MVSIKRDADALPDLVSQVPFAKDRIVKSWEALLHRPTSIFRPTTMEHVQLWSQLALKHRLKLTVIGGGHSAHSTGWIDLCCGSGGFVFASALGAQTGVRLTLVRKSGKLPPPTISVEKSPSHIWSTESGEL
ncbi:hypothetical protein BPOR_0892g00030 [Botrytis porri]|uniref:Uncharacterized protein n=1 Tax=Botrytis porri TaxID=87229 RepID=A0A4Z1K7X4_9HELO|nr:hypothetical protein BPOR_0892g00030 [Botrytis porri]